MKDLDEKYININNKNISLSNDNLINIKNLEKIYLCSTNNSEGNIDLDSIINNNSENSMDNSKTIIIDSNNIKDKNNEKNNTDLNNIYLSIDSKNIFTKTDPDFITDINIKLKTKYQNKGLAEKLSQFSQTINVNLLEFLYPKQVADFFPISQEISKIIKKNDFFKKDKLEKNIDYFFSQRVYFKYTDKLIIDIKFIHNCGPLLCYIYKNLEKYKINDSTKFINSIKEIKSKNNDILNDLYIYCNNKNLYLEKVKKIIFFKSIKKKYILQPELIFLLNMFHLVTKIIINFDFSRKEINSYEFHLFIIIILNISYLIKDFKDIKINFINKNIQNGINGIHIQDLKEEKNKHKIINKINKTFLKKQFDEKWDFENNFNVDIYKTFNNEDQLNYLDNKLKDYINIDFNDNNINFIENYNGKIEDLINRNIEEFKKCHTQSLNNINNNNKALKRRNTVNSSLNFSLNKCKTDFFKNYLISYVNKFSNIFEMIFVTLFSLDNIKNLEKIALILNECYYYECSSYFRNTCQINIGSSHILDFIYNKLINVKTLNLEINSFDLITFNRIIRLLYNNNNLINFKFSFFSSDCTYFPESIYNTYNQNKINKLMNINNTTIKVSKKGLNIKIEDIVLNNIYPYFIRNLNFFLEILKNKNLKTLGINMDIPSLLLNNEKYIISIIKFILNILILHYFNTKSNIEELILLSPNLSINGYKIPFFDKFLNNINNNKTLLSLSIQIKFFNIVNVHKLINNKLKILNIGDFDLFSLKHFIPNITKYSFCNNCSLEKISISINKSIINLNDELKLCIAQLFNIKINTLSSLSLYTNIEIKTIEEFQEFLSLINDNWISSYLILFNYKSYPIINNNLKLIKNINYIKEQNIKMQNIQNGGDANTDRVCERSGEVFRYLKSLFSKNNSSKHFDFYMRKKIIANILKFLYKSKIATIDFNIKKDSKIQL